MGGRRETVLVLGTAQRAAQATARSLVRGGFRVVGAWEGGHLAGHTRYCDRLWRIPIASDTPAFASAVRDLCARERVRAVVPLSDELLGALLTCPEAVGEAVLVGPSAEEFHRLCDKRGLAETAATVGIRCPRSIVVTAGVQPQELPSLPAYVKVATSVYGGIPAGRPVRVSEREECVRAMRRWTDRGEAVLVQEEVGGPHWRFHFVRGRTCSLQVAGRQLADYPYRVGQSTVMQFCAMPPQLHELSVRLLDVVGYRGLGSIQWIERDGEWYVHDVNLRVPAVVAGTIAAGLDMPRLAVETALGREHPSHARVRRLRYVWFPGELMALRDTFEGKPSGRGTAAIAASLLLGAISPRRRLVPFDLTDPIPTLACVTALVRRPKLEPAT